MTSKPIAYCDDNPPTGCKQCHTPLGFDFSFAFQPIVDMENHRIFGYEALVRDLVDHTAGSVLKRVDDNNRYAFDQACRVKAIGLASRLQLDGILSINFLPNAVYEPEHCIQSTLRAAKQFNFPISNLMFEVTESERVAEPRHLTHIFEYYQTQGLITALDDFGAGHAGLNMLANFQPNILKIDMELVSGIDHDRTKQIIVKHLLNMCHDLKITVLAEGLETVEEVRYFYQHGVRLMQGYFFAKPAFEALPQVNLDFMEQL